eukprot:13511307-Alexandrium_andersonii.AAC.2
MASGTLEYSSTCKKSNSKSAQLSPADGVGAGLGVLAPSSVAEARFRFVIAAAKCNQQPCSLHSSLMLWCTCAAPLQS